MPDGPTKTQRWLDLIALLLGRQIPLSVEQLMERVPGYAEKWSTGDPTAQASARRMFERDKDELRNLGIPLESVRYEINYGLEILEGYRITRRDFYLPYLRIVAGDGTVTAPERTYMGLPGIDLEPDEARIALDALRRMGNLPSFPFAADAQSALRKLTFDLHPDDFPATPVVWVEQPGAREVVDRLAVLSDALLARKRVRFRYHGIKRGTATDRDVAPYGLVFHRDWYLVGHDSERGGVRVFRVSRMEQVSPNTRAPKSPDYEVPADFELRRHLKADAWELGDEETVTSEVAFRFPLSLWAARNERGELVEERSDGTSVRRFRVTQANPFLRWVMSLGGEAEVLTPRELREEFREMADQVAALYGEENG